MASNQLSDLSALEAHLSGLSSLSSVRLFSNSHLLPLSPPPHFPALHSSSQTSCIPHFQVRLEGNRLLPVGYATSLLAALTWLDGVDGEESIHEAMAADGGERR